MIRFSKVSPWSMWCLGYIHGLSYMFYFKPHNYIWQFWVFLVVTYALGYFVWRTWYKRYQEAG